MTGPEFKLTQGNGDSAVTWQESTRQELTRFSQNPGHRFKLTRKEMDDSERTWGDDPAGVNPV